MDTELIEKNIENEELLTDIKLLNVIINDLNNCVKDQGEKLDLIENNLLTTDIIIDKSINELEKANEYKISLKKKYLTLAGISGILIYLLIL